MKEREEEGEIGKSSTTTSFFFFAINGRFLKIEKDYYGCKGEVNKGICRSM